ncbi:MAG: acyltransferase family protein [Aestuariibacter sp.]
MVIKSLIEGLAFLRFAPPDSQTVPSRRTDLDWLRVALFAMVILHHIGMFYTSNWGWHAKSQYRSEWLESVLLILEPWRMPAIWLISGIAIRFVLAKVNLIRFISMRTLRLLLPLLFGILVIVPPQLYIEMSLRGEIDMHYGTFFIAFLQPDHPIFERYTWGIWPHIDVNHLWYLRSLWYYSLYVVFLLPILNSQMIANLTQRFAQLSGFSAVLILCLPVFILQLLWGQDEWRYPIGFLFLLYGYLLGWQPELWRKIHKSTRPLFITFVLCTGALILAYNRHWIAIMQGAQASIDIEMLLVSIYSLTRIIGVLLMLSLTKYLMTTTSNLYHYCNDAVYPIYILHQTVIIVLGYQLNQLQLGPVAQPIVLFSGTLILCGLLYELIRRLDLLRPLFGLKMQGRYPPRLQQLGYASAAVLLSPLLITLIL